METGAFCVVRTQSAGAWAGNLESRNGKEVVLANAIHLFFWKGANALAGIAQDGVALPGQCKFTAPVDRVLLLEAIQILPTTEKAEASIKGVEVRPWWM